MKNLNLKTLGCTGLIRNQFQPFAPHFYSIFIRKDFSMFLFYPFIHCSSINMCLLGLIATSIYPLMTNFNPKEDHEQLRTDHEQLRTDHEHPKRAMNTSGRAMNNPERTMNNPERIMNNQRRTMNNLLRASDNFY